ncbi:glycoside hydrolase family 64 protein [Nostoc sp.]|uniref:glycoside hydrolase family 64 protein n=1 Tax=Nostoc sp. TaxID=1180 RepID=UPI002FF70E3F
MKFSFVNNTNQKYSSDEIYFVITGKNTSGQFCHVDKSGNLIPCNESDNDAPGHLTKNGQNWCHYLYTLNEISEIEVPPMYWGRAYISLGSPVYLRVINNGQDIVWPDPAYPSDPNADVYYDWVEFTIDNTGFFYGNTTQVDQFGFPMIIELIASDGSKKAGITESRSALFSEYVKTVPVEFQSLVQEPYRIISPFRGGFVYGGNYATYFDDYIRNMWQYYTSNQLQVRIPQGTFIGKVENNVFTFSKTDSSNAKYTIEYPTSSDIFRCNGVFTTGEAIQRLIQAQISAMFNRHILENPANNCKPEEFYKNSPANYYAQFWHLHSIDNKAYGFPVDDVCEQSSLIAHPNPEKLKVIISWD